MDAIIYDCEIIKAIPGKEAAIAGIDYCDGWRDFDNMGISVIGAYDFSDRRYRVFCQDNFGEFQRLLDSRKLIVDFNGTKFDRPLLKANGIEFDDKKHFDILREIWKAEGHDPDVFDSSTHGSYGLNACCVANGIGAKTGNGALAPIDWQAGNIGNVIDYCINDVAMTVELFNLIIAMGYIQNPKHDYGSRIFIDRTDAVLQLSHG